MNIIVAEDDKVMSLMYCGILSEGGHVVLPAYDAMQTMMFAMKQPPDLVLLDVNMPGGTGMDVLRKLKMFPKTKHVPVVVITGSTDELLPAQVLELGAKRFLSKPVDPEVLLAAVREAIL